MDAALVWEEWVFWLKTKRQRHRFMTISTAEYSRHFDDIIRAVWRHVMFLCLLFCFFRLTSWLPWASAVLAFLVNNKMQHSTVFLHLTCED